MSTGRLTQPGAIQAPFGHNKPAPPSGYTAVGTGRGNWEFVPVAVKKKTGSTSHKQPNKKAKAKH
jgi:hypothetical protein